LNFFITIVAFIKCKKYYIILLSHFFLINNYFAQTKTQNFYLEKLNRYKLYGIKEQGGIIIGKAENPKSISLNDNEILFDDEGYFVLGFDRDAKLKQNLTIEYKNNTKDSITLKIKKRNYNIQHIRGLKKEHVLPPPQLQERIKREAEILTNARKSSYETKTAYFRSGFIRPVEGGRISSRFGDQRILNDTLKQAAHNGVDISLPKGSPVKAMADGYVRIADYDFFYAGNTVMIDHGLGIVAVYIHLDSVIAKKNTLVKKGEVIGTVGSTGRSTSDHLHWGVQWFDKRIDPLNLLKLKNSFYVKHKTIAENEENLSN